MSTVGLVVEYNPLHNGHLYHIQQSRKITEAESVIAVMSGHFLQRGEPAIADKWSRTEMALRAGCDLVLELPVAYSAQPAQWFAYGAVAALAATGVCDALCFGSESGDAEALARIADRLSAEPESMRLRLGALLKEGLPYPSAYAAAARELLEAAGEADAAFGLAQPNHTLGLHYLLALRKLGCPMKALSIRREKSDYNQTAITDTAIASATALRKLIGEAGGALDGIAPYVPGSTLSVLRREASAGRAPVTWDVFARPLFHLLGSLPASELASYAEVTEGLEHRIKGALRDIRSWRVDELLDLLKTKRYTRTKLQRTLLRILLGHRKEDLDAERLAAGVQYVRVLGFTARGQALLRRMKKTAAVPVVHSAADGDWPYLAMDARATAVYTAALAASRPADAWRDYTQPPVRV
ncbi:nucleotidyltransferase [Cohnella hashimotonis]|uniref:tRNA(Met) cytidine acetate ligase n=1 Tax=Cohnella hashimotonis TaxID=2826895 RepID=A0ABT6THU1_9BACL|nr:nucleotidyltransferase [Cohnella hashimotonis]MDI4646295.1 nucleotidyltransferase [Cohnella hashimotonis]